MELLEIENLNAENKTLKATFDGLFIEGFYIITDFDFDLEPETNLNGEVYFEVRNITFWDFKIFTDDELITLNKADTKRIKQLIDFELTNILNNN